MNEPNKELDRLEEIYAKKGKLMNIHIATCRKLFEGNFSRLDSMHLSLLELLQQMDDDIQKLQSEQFEIVENSKEDIIKKLNSAIPQKEMNNFKAVPDELWAIFRNKGRP